MKLGVKCAQGKSIVKLKGVQKSFFSSRKINRRTVQNMTFE